MADQVRVSTEWLDKSARELKNVQSSISEVLSRLGNVDTSRDAGGSYRFSLSCRLRSCDQSFRGSCVREDVQAMESAMRALSRDIDGLSAQVRAASDRFSNAESSILSMIGSAAGRNGNAGSMGNSSYSAIDINYWSSSQVLNKNREKWESQDPMIGTDYDTRMMQELRDKILNDPDFSEENWKNCKTREQKEAFLTRLVQELQEVYDTELEGGIYYVYDDDFEIRNSGIGGSNVWNKKEAEKVFNFGGYDLIVHRNANGSYYSGTDMIIMNNIDDRNFGEILNTLCHENRHNLQAEIKQTEDVTQIPGLSQSDYEKIAEARETWIREENGGNFKNMSQAEIQAKREEYDREASWWQKVFFSSTRETYAQTEAYEDYAGQQFEVDARYAGEYAEKCVKEKQVLDMQESLRNRRRVYIMMPI